MKIIMRGMMVHILLREDGEITEIFQDTMIQPPEKFNIELHLDKNHDVLSLILLDVGTNTEHIISILKNFILKFKDAAQYPHFATTFESIIKELAKQEPLYQKNLFRFDIE
ncbi:MAG: hypothetical protein LUQ65_00635 [Candidatus Helarchaeota archaeon]|nr:hypothetical protein [Candidatus Helarchaeota archaeon]